LISSSVILFLTLSNATKVVKPNEKPKQNHLNRPLDNIFYKSTILFKKISQQTLLTNNFGDDIDIGPNPAGLMRISRISFNYSS